MNISFDLDSTLIPNGKEFETEKRSRIARLIGIEEIRKGTPELITELKNQGNKIHIYTTSFRTKSKIRRTLKYYGIRVDRIINQTDNQRELKARNLHSSKYPPAFGFDIHIDDSKGVGIESEQHDFTTIIIEPSDKNWVKTITEVIQTTFQFKVLKRLLKELWLRSNECNEPIENIWFSVQETAKSNGVTRKEVRKYLNILIDNSCIKITSQEPLLFEFTEIGKKIKSDSEIKKFIKKVG